MRALTAHDAASARALAQSVYGGTRYLKRILELVDFALPGDDLACEALVLTDDHESARALLIHGTVGGAAGVTKIHALMGTDDDAPGVLLDALRATERVRDSRMFVCELSVERVDEPAARALMSAGFNMEGTIADFFADDIDLRLLALRM